MNVSRMQLLDLRIDGLTAIHDCSIDTRSFCELDCGLMDLRGEFTRRGHDHDHGAGWHVAFHESSCVVGQHLVEERQKKRGGLS